MCGFLSESEIFFGSRALCSLEEVYIMTLAVCVIAAEDVKVARSILFSEGICVLGYCYMQDV